MNAIDGAFAAWRETLLEARTVDQLVCAIETVAAALPGIDDSRVIWERDAGIEGDGDSDSDSDSDSTTSLELPASNAVLTVTAADGSHPDAIATALAPVVATADPLLQRLRRLAELEQEVVKLQNSEKMQRALFAISQLSGSDRDMSEVLRGIHDIVGTLMYAENFFIALLDPTHDTIRMLYFVDVEDSPLFEELPREDLKHSATWYVLRDGRPLRGSREYIRTQVDGPLRLVGTYSSDWLGVPMLRDGAVHGAIVVQS